jgi:hypothetical protein
VRVTTLAVSHGPCSEDFVYVSREGPPMKHLALIIALGLFASGGLAADLQVPDQALVDDLALQAVTCDCDLAEPVAVCDCELAIFVATCDCDLAMAPPPRRVIIRSRY